MPWVLLAAVSLVLFLLCLRPFRLRRVWTAALWAAGLYLLVNATLLSLGLYSFREPLYEIYGMPVLLLVAAGALAPLFVRFQPRGRGWQLLYVLALSILLAAVEYFFADQGLIVYAGAWTLHHSLLIYFLGLIALLWLSELTVRKHQGYTFK